ncbi:MAG: endonuclease [Candidatus Aenigmarchaeota archaeon]|nr:endonuclease [Candidatus Aenigmarchaeota archaeon]
MELIILFALVVLIVALAGWVRHLRRQVSRLAFDKLSQAARHGRMAEQFLPFAASYPYDPQEFRFLGSPIDGVQFSPEKIVLVEFKAGGRLSVRQREIKRLVEAGKVTFEEIAVR